MIDLQQVIRELKTNLVANVQEQEKKHPECFAATVLRKHNKKIHQAIQALEDLNNSSRENRWILIDRI